MDTKNSIWTTHSARNRVVSTNWMGCPAVRGTVHYLSGLLVIMIDRNARNHLAERLRHLVTGVITNYRFERLARRSQDPVIWDLEERLAWPVYDDIHEHRLTGPHSLTHGQRRDFARAILFLKTDLEYEWTHKHGVRAFINSTFRLRPLRQIPPIKLQCGDVRVWPFYRKADYANALKKRVYLCGAQA